MAVYRDKKRNTWYAQFRYKDWSGKITSTTKRGFRTKKDALKFQNEFLASQDVRIMNITLNEFVEIYFEDKVNELKSRSARNKRYMMERHLLTYLGERKMSEIEAADIIKWENIMESKGLSESYLRMIWNQISSLFTHAERVYRLPDNPCRRVRTMGKGDVKRINFWTREEYDMFLSSFDEKDKYRLVFEILFWTGMREGELLALCKKDINLELGTIDITKTFYRHAGQDVITSPKTAESIRKITIPKFLVDEISDYLERLYKYPDSERIFQVGAEAVQHVMKRHIEKAGVPKIRVHDLRHSHASYLINQGVDPLLLKERLGHKDIKITLNTYSHLYPNKQTELAEKLNDLK